jgi:hypothetical protein
MGLFDRPTVFKPPLEKYLVPSRPTASVRLILRDKKSSVISSVLMGLSGCLEVSRGLYSHIISYQPFICVLQKPNSPPPQVYTVAGTQHTTPPLHFHPQTAASPPPASPRSAPQSPATARQSHTRAPRSGLWAWYKGREFSSGRERTVIRGGVRILVTLG